MAAATLMFSSKSFAGSCRESFAAPLTASLSFQPGPRNSIARQSKEAFAESSKRALDYIQLQLEHRHREAIDGSPQFRALTEELLELSQQKISALAKATDQAIDPVEEAKKHAEVLGTLGALLFLDALALPNSRQASLVRAWARTPPIRSNLESSKDFHLILSELLPKTNPARRALVWSELGLSYLPGRDIADFAIALRDLTLSAETPKQRSRAVVRVSQSLALGISIDFETQLSRVEDFPYSLWQNRRPAAIDFVSTSFDQVERATAHDIYTHDIGADGHLTANPPFFVSPADRGLLEPIGLWIKLILALPQVKRSSTPVTASDLKVALLYTNYWMLFETPENAHTWISVIKGEPIHPRIIAITIDSLSQLQMQHAKVFSRISTTDLFGAMIEVSPSVKASLPTSARKRSSAQ